RELELDLHRREMVLDRLVRTDRVSELRARLRVLDGDRDHALRESEALRGRVDGPALERAARGRQRRSTARDPGSRAEARIDAEQPAQRVDRRLTHEKSGVAFDQVDLVVGAD